MKKIGLFCAVAGLALGAMAGTDGLKFKFSSSGDVYADGKAVQDGEVYALVWVKSGASFAGFNADGTLVDAVNNDLEAVSVAQGGGCVTTVFVVDEKDDAGTYSMYLLDTRTASVDADGNVVEKVTGLVDGKITTVSGTVKANVTFAELADLAAAEVKTVDGSDESAVVSSAAIPATVGKPVVSGFTLADGGAVLTVSGTVPYVQYNVYGGLTPAGIDYTKPLATFLNGKTSGDLELKVSDVGENKFFKVATK